MTIVTSQDPPALTEQRASLDAEGYVVLPGLVPPSRIEELRELVARELARADEDPLWRAGGTVHLESLLDAGPAVDAVWTAPTLLAAVRHLLGEQFALRRLHLRSPRPGFGAQALHTDGVRDRSPDPREATAIVALVDVGPDGGATRVIPGSHRRHGFTPPRQPDLAHPDQRSVPLTAGDALVFGEHLWHSGTRNDGPHRRDALQLSFHRRVAGVDASATVEPATLARLGPAAKLLR